MLGNGHKLRQRFGLHFLHHIVAMGLHDTCGKAYRPSNLLVGIAEEVCRSHAGLHRAERMLDRLATQAHGLWVCIKALLHSCEQMLMLPSWNPPLWPCRALRFERATLTGCGPVAPYPLAVFLIRKAIWQLLSSRTAIGV